MEPKSLSASAIKTFQDCEAGYKASYIDRIRTPSGAPAELGTAVHDTCEWAVQTGVMERDQLNKIHDKFAGECARYGLDDTMVKDGRKMLKDWYERWQDNPPHEVLSTEVKENFLIKSTDGQHEVIVNYIWDRGDRMADGSIDVVDYKTWRQVMDAQDMRRNQQVRIYALSAAIRYKADNPPVIWVTLDQMRTGPVSVKFSKEDNRATYNWLRSVFDQILESDGTQETINENCRYCVRRAECVTLDRAVQTGNIQALLADPARAARKLAELKAVKNAMDYTISELEEFMEALLEENGVPELEYDGVVVKMNVRKSRKPEAAQIARVVGGEIMQAYGKLGMKEIDELLTRDDLTEEQKRQVKQAITTTATGKATANFKK